MYIKVPFVLRHLYVWLRLSVAVTAVTDFIITLFESNHCYVNDFLKSSSALEIVSHLLPKFNRINNCCAIPV